MATRFLLRRLPLSGQPNLNGPATPATAAFSYFLRRNISSPVESKSRSSPNDDDVVWSSKLGGRAFGLAEADNGDWNVYEREIMKDIEGTVMLAREILLSGRYKCGDRLSPEDEKEVVERLLAYHPRREDKVGCGIDSIMMDKHQVYGRSRCFFVVRLDRSVKDFSFRKCLASYVKQKYPYDAESFIWKMRHFFWREEFDVCERKMKG